MPTSAAPFSQFACSGSASRKSGRGQACFPLRVVSRGEESGSQALPGLRGRAGPREEATPCTPVQLIWHPRSRAGRSPQCGKGQCRRHSRTGCLLPQGFLASCLTLLTLELWHPTHAFLLPTPRSNVGALGAPALLSTSSSSSLVGSAIVQGQLRRRKDRTTGRAWGLA